MNKEFRNIFDDVWKDLVRGSVDKKHPYQRAVVGTVGGGVSNLRTIVLRNADSEIHRLFFHTDQRSAKVSDLLDNPILSWLFYHPKRQIQLRISSEIKIHLEDETSKYFWDKGSTNSLKGYTGPYAPGTLLINYSHNVKDGLLDKTPERHEIESGYKNFTIIEALVTEIEYLRLGRNGHKRIEFSLKNREWVACWVAP